MPGTIEGEVKFCDPHAQSHPPSAELGAADAASGHRGETAVRYDSDRGRPQVPAAQQRSAGSAASNTPGGCRPFLPRGRYRGPGLGPRPRHPARAPPNSVDPSSCMAGRGSLTARRLRAAPRSRGARGIFFLANFLGPQGRAGEGRKSAPRREAATIRELRRDVSPPPRPASSPYGPRHTRTPRPPLALRPSPSPRPARRGRRDRSPGWARPGAETEGSGPACAQQPDLEGVAYRGRSPWRLARPPGGVLSSSSSPLRSQTRGPALRNTKVPSHVKVGS